MREEGGDMAVANATAGAGAGALGKGGLLTAVASAVRSLWGATEAGDGTEHVHKGTKRLHGASEREGSEGDTAYGGAGKRRRVGFPVVEVPAAMVEEARSGKAPWQVGRRGRVVGCCGV